MLKDACAKFQVFPIIDVAAKHANAKCYHYFGEDFTSVFTDGLEKVWNEDFFMNPPYSEVDKWMGKAYYEHRKHNVNGLILVYSKTDHRLASHHQ